MSVNFVGETFCCEPWYNLILTQYTILASLVFTYMVHTFFSLCQADMYRYSMEPNKSYVILMFDFLQKYSKPRDITCLIILIILVIDTTIVIAQNNDALSTIELCDTALFRVSFRTNTKIS